MILSGRAVSGSSVYFLVCFCLGKTQFHVRYEGINIEGPGDIEPGLHRFLQMKFGAINEDVQVIVRRRGFNLCRDPDILNREIKHSLHPKDAHGLIYCYSWFWHLANIKIGGIEQKGVYSPQNSNKKVSKQPMYSKGIWSYLNKRVIIVMPTQHKGQLTIGETPQTRLYKNTRQWWLPSHLTAFGRPSFCQYVRDIQHTAAPHWDTTE